MSRFGDNGNCPHGGYWRMCVMCREEAATAPAPPVPAMTAPLTEDETLRALLESLGFTPVRNDFDTATKAALLALRASRDEAARLREALKEVRPEGHVVCEDGFYSCPKAEGYFGPNKGGDCECGRDWMREVIDAALTPKTGETK